MELTKKFLSALGVEGDKADQICEAHSDAMKRIKTELDDLQGKYDAIDGDLKKITAERDKMKKLLPDDSGENPFEKKFNDMKKKYDDLKAEIDGERLLSKKKEAFKALCKDAELSEKGTEKAMKYADWDKVELDENGAIKGKDDHIKGLKDEWSDYAVKTETTGAEQKTPPKGEDSGTPSRAKELAARYREANYGTTNTETK